MCYPYIFVGSINMIKPKVLFTFGTRPEAIKMAPVVQAFLADPAFTTKIVLTAQHREMLDQVMSIFNLTGDYDFNIMIQKQSLAFITTSVLTKFSEVLEEEKPDLVFVHGDTTTTYSCSLASFYQNIPVAHVEAGLRSGDLRNPFPEEMNRKLADALCSLHFCPTLHARNNLLKENIKSSGMFITGNTVIDSLFQVIEYLKKNNPQPKTVSSLKRILVTLHRRESWGEPIENVARAIRDVVNENPDVSVIFPIHKNPIVRESVGPILGGMDRVDIVEPMDYLTFVTEMQDAYIIISDSGGIQEEAPSLGKPVLLTRAVTERPEGIESGVVKMIGTDFEKVKSEITKLVQNETYYKSMMKIRNPFGDGKASIRILAHTKKYFSLPNPEHLKEFGEYVA